MPGKKRAAKRAPKRAENSAKRKRSSRPARRAASGVPFRPGNPWRFQKGQSGNPGGRPRLISDAYREWLAAEDEQGVTNAAKIAFAQGLKAIVSMDTQAAKEIRQATEGTRLTTWQDDVVKLLREGKVTPEQVQDEFGDELAAELASAAGLSGSQGGEVEAPGESG